MLPFSGPGKKQSGQNTKEKSGPNTQDQTFQRSTALKGGKQPVICHHIQCRCLIHTAKPKDQSGKRGLRCSEQTSNHHNRNICSGHRYRRNVDIPQKGRGHNQLQRDQNPQTTPFKFTIIPLFSIHSPTPVIRSFHRQTILVYKRFAKKTKYISELCRKMSESMFSYNPFHFAHFMLE